MKIVCPKLIQHGSDNLLWHYKSRVMGCVSLATVVLHVLAPTTPSVLLLDEPEAFLHPPQARLLGEIIAKERSPQAQLFVATHSTDVLQGLVNAASNNLRVLRMQRDGNVNRIKELDKEKVRTMSVDPLLKHSSVMSGLFHERVIICESDADCLFYASLLDLSEVHGERHPDVNFGSCQWQGSNGLTGQNVSGLGGARRNRGGYTYRSR